MTALELGQTIALLAFAELVGALLNRSLPTWLLETARRHGPLQLSFPCATTI